MIEIDCRHPIYSVSFAEDGKQLLSSGAEGALQRWRVDDGRKVGEPIRTGNAEIYAAALSPNRKWFVCGLSFPTWEDGRVFTTIWDANKHKKVLDVHGHTDSVFTLDISPDSTKFTTGSADKLAFVWDIATGDRLVGPLHHDGWVVAVRFSPSGDRIATATAENPSARSIRIYNSENGQRLLDIPFRVYNPSSSLAWSADGRRLHASSYSQVQRFDSSSGTLLYKWTVPGGGSSTSIVLSHNQSFMAVVAYASLSFWDTSTDRQVGSVIHHTSHIWSIALSPNDDCIAIAEANGKVIVRSLHYVLPSSYLTGSSSARTRGDSQSTARTIEPKKRCEIYSVSFIENGKHVVSGGAEGVFQQWRVSDGHKVGDLFRNKGAILYSAALSLDCKWFVCGFRSSRSQKGESTQPCVAVWDAKTHEKFLDIKSQVNSVASVDISPDSTRLATGSTDNSASIWSITTGERLVRLQHDSCVVAVRFSPTGDRIATAAARNPDAKSVRVYNSENGQLLLEIPFRVGEYISSPLVWSSDGRQLFAASYSQVHRFDSSSGSALKKWTVPGGQSSASITLSRNTKFAVVVAYRTISFWDTSTDKQIGSALSHASTIWSIALSPKDDCIATGDENGEVTLWSLQGIIPDWYLTVDSPAITSDDHPSSFRLIEINNQHPIYSVSFVEDGKQVLGGGGEGVLQRWRVDDGHKIGEPIRTADAKIYATALSPDRKWFFCALRSSTDKRAQPWVAIWDVQKHEKVFDVRCHTGSIFSLDVSSDSTKLATGSNDKSVFIWDVITGNRLVGPLQHNSPVVVVRFSPSGDCFATATRNDPDTNSIHIYNSEDGQQLLKIPLQVNQDVLSPLAWSGDGRQLLAASCGQLQRFDSSSGSLLSKWSIPGSGSSASVVPSHNQKFLVVVSSGLITFWDYFTERQIGTVIHHTSLVWTIVISPHDDRIAVGGEDGKVILWNLRDILPESYLPVNSSAGARDNLPSTSASTESNGRRQMYSVFFDTDGKQVLSGGAEGVIQRWGVDDGHKAEELYRTEGTKIFAAALSPDRKWLVCGLRFLKGDDGQAWAAVWDARTYEKVLDIRGHTNSVFSLDVSPDSTKVVTGSTDQLAFVWDIITGERLVGPLKHDGWVVTVRFSPTGDRIATAAARNPDAKSIRVYDSKNGEQLLEIPFKLGTYISSSVTWSADGRQLLAASYSGVKRFDAASGTLVSKWSVPGGGSSASVILSHNRKFIVVAASGSLSFWDSSTEKKIGSVIKQESSVLSIALSAKDDYIATGEESGKVTILSLRDILPDPYLAANVSDQLVNGLKSDWSRSTPRFPHIQQLCAQVVSTRNKEDFSRRIVYSPSSNDKSSRYSAAIFTSPPIPSGSLAEGSSMRALLGIWEATLKDADEAIAADPLSPIGYEKRHAALHELRRFDEAVDAFSRMLSLTEQSSDPDARQRGKKYISPSVSKTAIEGVVHGVFKVSPLVLIDVKSGRLCDSLERMRTFKSEPEFFELVSSMTQELDNECIQRAVDKYFLYVTFSHVWDGKEPSFQDVDRAGSVWSLDASPLNEKLKQFCTRVQKDGYRWAWSDTCCIDKTISIVLHQSLKMMYKWYEASAATFVFLANVESTRGAIERSIWMTRAWTAQELLAPKVIRFYDRNWKLYMGDARSNHKECPEIMQELANATGVARETILSFNPDDLTVREKLRLAAPRKARVEEDVAYALIGIFKSDIKPDYGEGYAALGHLLEEIVDRLGEVTVLAWTGKSSPYNSCLPVTLEVYGQNLCTSVAVDGAEMELRVAALRNALNKRDAAFIYDRITRLPPARFANRRLHLPCIIFAVRRLGVQDLGQGHEYSYRARVSGIGDVKFQTSDRLPLREPRRLIFVHPWIRDLRDPLPWSGSVDDDEDDDDDDARSRHNLEVEAGAESVPASPLHALPAATVDEYTRALRLVARLQQPFNALLLQQQTSGEFKRIATEHEIVVPGIESTFNFGQDIHTDVVGIL